MAERENLPIPENPDFNLEIGGLQPDDPVHFGQMNDILARLLTNDAFLEKLAGKMVEKALIAHVLDSTNPSMVLGADQAPALTRLLDVERQRIAELYSDLGAEIYDGNIDSLHRNCVVQVISGRTTGSFPNVNYTGSFLTVINNGPNFTSQRLDIITNKKTASHKRSWYYGNDTDYPGWSPWSLDISNSDFELQNEIVKLRIENISENRILFNFIKSDNSGYRFDFSQSGLRFEKITSFITGGVTTIWSK